MRRSVIIYTILVCITVTYACSRRPGNVLSSKKMESVLYDIRLAEALLNSGVDGNYDQVIRKDALMKSVLDKHKITQADLDTSLVWYSDNVTIYKQINDSVSSRLRNRANKMREVLNEKQLAKSERRQELIPSYFYLTESTPRLSFNIDSVKLKTIKASAFRMKFDVQGISPVQHVTAGFYFTYKDTSIQRTIPIDENKYYEIDKPQMPDSLLKGISGYIRMKDTRLPSRIMIYNISYQDSTVSKDIPQKEETALPDNQKQAERVEPLPVRPSDTPPSNNKQEPVPASAPRRQTPGRIGR